jgi:hypothetical protein
MANFGNRQSGYFSNLKGGGAIAGAPYGSFFDTTIQTATLANTAYAMQLNTSDSPSNSGIVVINDAFAKPTCIQVSQTGVYNIQFSAQFYRTNSGTDVLDIWLRKNGIDIPATNTQFVMSGSVVASQIVTAWNFFVNAVANDYYQLMWATPDTHVELLYAPAQTSPFAHPSIPSVILTMNRVS